MQIWFYHQSNERSHTYGRSKIKIYTNNETTRWTLTCFFETHTYKTVFLYIIRLTYCSSLILDYNLYCNIAFTLYKQHNHLVSVNFQIYMRLSFLLNSEILKFNSCKSVQLCRFYIENQIIDHTCDCFKCFLFNSWE